MPWLVSALGGGQGTSVEGASVDPGGAVAMATGASAGIVGAAYSPRNDCGLQFSTAPEFLENNPSILDESKSILDVSFLLNPSCGHYA